MISVFKLLLMYFFALLSFQVCTHNKIYMTDDCRQVGKLAKCERNHEILGEPDNSFLGVKCMIFSD